MKMVPLGLSIIGILALFGSEAAILAGMTPKPTPTPKSGNRSSAAICCVEWDGKGNCVRQGMIRGGGCPDPPTRRVVTSTPTATTESSERAITFGREHLSSKEVAPTTTPSTERGLGQLRSQPGLLNKEAITSTPSAGVVQYKDGDDMRHKNSGHASEKIALTPTPDAERDKLKGTTRTQGDDTTTMTTTTTSSTEKKTTPVPKVDSINLNSSRSNIYRVRPTPTPTPGKKR